MAKKRAVLTIDGSDIYLDYIPDFDSSSNKFEIADLIVGAAEYQFANFDSGSGRYVPSEYAGTLTLDGEPFGLVYHPHGDACEPHRYNKNLRVWEL
jgi:hypothetical protein